MALGKRNTLRGFAALLAVAALSAAAPAMLTPAVAVAAEPTQLDILRARIAKSVAQWESAKTAESETRSRYETLAHRIEALKRLRAKSAATFAGEGELDRLLRESIDAQAALEGARETVEGRANVVKKGVSEAVAMIDAKVKDLLPMLKQGSMPERQARARTINELRAARRDLTAIYARLSETSALPREWSKYEVTIDPLDSPDELDEKADSVEDTRDRFERKREELSKLIADVKREQEISRAAQEFRTDIGIFDEEARRGRVTKQPSSSPTVLATEGTESGKTADNAPQSPPTRGSGGADDVQSPPPGPQASSPPPGFGGTTPPADSDPNNGLAESPTTPAPPVPQSNDRVTTGGGGGAAATPSPTTGVAGGGVPGSPLTRQLDPNALLNLRVEKIDGRQVKLETLEALLSDLNRLERFLDTRAGEIRKRAKQLKQDEARALGKTK